MANTHTTLTSLFTDIADAIRERTGRTESIIADEFPTWATDIVDNSVFLSIIDKTVEDLENAHLEGLTSIGNRAFYGCTSLALTSLPEGITSIGNGAFSDCTSLALTSLPESLTSIGNSAFFGCTNLALTSLPESLTSIGNSAFSGCTSLALTSLPEGVTSIDAWAFERSNLKTITFKGIPNYIGSSIFSRCYYLTTINVPWSEGEVANSPWGATNATINYNYTGG